ncbi:MAG: hypothetical protein A2V93_06720 [Ignavibacteria bacterium RBG_16_34_14]|nr:MAG: hypothetical protein A2V93_06720 [Ignavibacteria bacterium RBG_16_34_14]
MIIYSVTIYINKDVEKEWLDWMKKIHIQDIIDTGHFNSYKIYKVVVPAHSSDETAYCIQYDCKSMKDYTLYLEKHASRLQREHTIKFQNKVKAARAVMEEI